jgi:transposase
LHDATSDAGFGCPDLTAFCRLGELDLIVTGQRHEPDRVVLACRVVEPDDWCRRCGCRGVPRGSVVRRLAHEPFGWRPTTLQITVRRYRCDECAHVWRQDTTRAAEPRAKLSRRGLRWALEGLVVQHLTVARVAAGLGVSWHTANDAVLAEGKRVLIDDPSRFDGVAALGVDEHVWRHTRRGDKYVTVVIDLTGIRDGTGPARLLDMVEGRSKQAFTKWLADRPQAWRDAIEVVAMDGFTGFKTATTQELPAAVAVMDPFTWCASPATRWTAAGAVSSRRSMATAAAKMIRSTGPDAPCTPVLGCLPTASTPSSTACSPTTSTSRSKRPGRSTSR